MSAAKSGRGRGRPRREYRIRVRGERREVPDYDKLARALLEHAAMQAQQEKPPRPDTADDDGPDATEMPS